MCGVLQDCCNPSIKHRGLFMDALLKFLFLSFFFWLCRVWRHLGSSLWRAGFSLVVACRFSLLWLWHAGSRVRGLCSSGTRVPERMCSVVCGTRALQLWHVCSIVVAHGLVAPQHVGSQFPHPGLIGRRILYHWTTREVPKISYL